MSCHRKKCSREPQRSRGQAGRGAIHEAVGTRTWHPKREVPLSRVSRSAGNPRHNAGSSETGATGLEPATSGVTGRRSNQLSYAPERFGWADWEQPEERKLADFRPRSRAPGRFVKSRSALRSDFLLSIVAVILAATCSIAAAHLIVVGSSLTGAFNGQDCTGPSGTWANDTLGEASVDASSPVDGVVVSWRMHGNFTNGQTFDLRVLRPAGGGAYTGAGTSAQKMASGGLLGKALGTPTCLSRPEICSG